MRGGFFIAFLILFAPLFGAGVEVGQYDDPRDLTIKIVDPFSQENTDLMQPVVGEYDIKVLPPHVDQRERTGQYDVQGMYFKQIGKFIYIDIRQPPRQKKAGAYDLFVSLKVPGQADTSNRLRPGVIYTDAATDVLLLIDNSMSMKKNDPLGLRFNACENFVRLASLSNRIEKVGLVKFSGSASKILDWTSPSRANRRGIRSLLASQRAGSFTNINEAFEVAAEMFEDSVATEKVAVLLTDGKNEPDRYRDTHDFLRELGVKVYTVGLSKNADSSQLEIIAEETGGEFFKAVDDGRLMQIYNKIAQQLNEFRTLRSGENVKKLEFPLTSHDQLVEVNLYGYSKGSEFILNNEQGERVDFQMITGGKGQQTTLLRLSKPRSGIYGLQTKEGSAFSYDINVQSKLFMKVFPMDHKYLRGEVAHFAISLAHLQEPILNGEVFATLSRPDGQVMKRVQLFDDGVHGDNHANDGVYCAILPLDFAEGMVEIEFLASGKTADGQETLRVERGSFRILEAGQGARDYFLASILPLYIDLGKVKQGALTKASLRLSFEGREARTVSFEPGDDLVSKIDEEAMIPWSAISFPEAFELKPSEAQVATLSVRLPTNQALGPFSGSFYVRIGDQDLQVPVDIVVQEGDLVRMVTGVKKFEPVSIEREAIVEPLEKIMVEPESMESQFVRSSQGLDPEVTLKKDMEVTDLGANPQGGDRPDSLEVVEKKKASLPIEYSLSPERIESFKVEEGDYASLIFTLQNHSKYGGNVSFRLEGPGELERNEVWLEGGANISLGWYWEAGELELAQQSITLRSVHFDEEKSRTWNWEPIPKELPWALIYTLIILGVIGLVYGILFLIQWGPPQAYVSLSAWAHFFLVLWAFWHLLPINFEELDLDRELLTFELEWEEPLEREVDVPEEELVSQERPKEVVPDAQRLERVKQDQKIERDMKEVSKTEQASRAVALKRANVSPRESKREIREESMLIEKPTVLSVNDRPKRRAVLKKRDPAKAVSKNLNRKKEVKSIRRLGTNLQAPAPTPDERELKLTQTQRQELLPEIKGRVIDPSKLKPMTEVAVSPLDLKEEDVQKVGVRERENKQEKDRELKMNPLQAKENISRIASSSNISLPVPSEVKPVTLAAFGKQPLKSLDGGVEVATAPSVLVEAQSLDLEKEAVRKIVSNSKQQDVVLLEGGEVALEDSPLGTYLPEKKRALGKSGQTYIEGSVGIESLRPVEDKGLFAKEAWVPDVKGQKVNMKADSSEESWVGQDEVKEISVVEKEEMASRELNPSMKREAMMSRGDIPEAASLAGQRASIALEATEGRLNGVEKAELLSEQPVELILEEKASQKVVKQGAGAVIRMEEPKPSELPLEK